MTRELNNRLFTADLEISPELGQVRVKENSIRLGPVNMRVLMFLVQNKNKVVSRNEIFDNVWGNQTISDDTLTRCISDLRSQLKNISSAEKLIATIPKRGYQWLPEVGQLTENNNLQSENKKPLWYWLIIGIITLILLSTSFLWFANQFVTPHHIKIAFVPLQSKESTQNIANDIEDLLRAKILKTKKLRFLSGNILTKSNKTHYADLSNEFGAQWIVEGRVRKNNNAIKVTLSLVDARTALVFHNVSTEFTSKNAKLDTFSSLFIADLVRLSKP